METLVVIFKVFVLVAGSLLLAIVIISIIQTLIEEVISKRRNKKTKETLDKVLKGLEVELKSQIEEEDKKEKEEE